MSVDKTIYRFGIGPCEQGIRNGSRVLYLLTSGRVTICSLMASSATWRRSGTSLSSRRAFLVVASARSHPYSAIMGGTTATWRIINNHFCRLFRGSGGRSSIFHVCTVSAILFRVPIRVCYFMVVFLFSSSFRILVTFFGLDTGRSKRKVGLLGCPPVDLSLLRLEMEDSKVKSKPRSNSVHHCIPRVTITNLRVVLVAQTAGKYFEDFFHFLHIVNHSSSQFCAFNL